MAKSDLTDVKIANMALGRIGSRIAIGSLGDTTTVEAIEANRYFAACRDRVLDEVDWPFASTYADLTGKVDGADQAGDLSYSEANWLRNYRFAYAYPTDAIAIREFITGDGRMPAEKVAFEIALYDPPGATPEGLYVLCDLDSADDDVTIRYTKQHTDYTEWSHLAGSALAWLLASELANVLPVDPKLADRAMQMYEYEKRRALAAARNESQRDDAPDGDFLAARE